MCIHTKFLEESGMEEIDEEPSDEAWRIFLRRYWKMTAVAAGLIAAAVIVAFLVFLWVVADAQATQLVPSDLGLWTVGYCFTFVIEVIIWELILVASWAIPVAVVIFFLWYRKIPVEERQELERRPKKKWPQRGRSAGGSGGFSFLVTLTWLVIVWVEGRWNTAFEAWTFTDWVNTWIAACLWDLLIFGIPLAIILVLWIRKPSLFKSRTEES
jgi:hypothetical protein